ncbi:hypothetical protein Rxyl_2261 [Rubrobacter xylanophilus DSM 9941]|uniref:Uncharacterized protein n=1 Tax=Rubrobacter xylanophilus (strain DSM 9941 / JCM 11954 / NBRC 16129 / PRD-1) TaxID=266117 RepID=Q1ATT7_RUBXD|nr:hypothetical protein Rxyl_2261 [Rubrobacter xylanophilus DSM 9941]
MDSRFTSVAVAAGVWTSVICDMRKSLVATLRKAHLIADSAHRALGRVASLHFGGRFDAPSTRASCPSSLAVPFSCKTVIDVTHSE